MSDVPPSTSDAGPPPGCTPLGLGLVAMGIAVGMLLWPDYAEGQTAIGRYAWIKEILIAVWGLGPAAAFTILAVAVPVTIWGAGLTWRTWAEEQERIRREAATPDDAAPPPA